MKKIQLKDFMEYKFLSNVQYNIDKTVYAYVVANSNDKNGYNRNIWITKDNKTKQLTGLNDCASYIWLNNDELLIQTKRSKEDKEKSNRGEDTSSFYLININGGEALKAFDIPLEVSTIKYIKKNTYILTANSDVNNPDMYMMNDKQREAIIKDRKDNEDYQIIDEVPFWFNGTTFTNKTRTRLFVFNTTKGKLTPITEPMFDVEGFNVDTNTQQVVYWGSVFTNIVEIKDDIYTYDLKSKKVSTVCDSKEYGVSYVNYYKKGLISIMSDNKVSGMNQNNHIYFIDKNNKISLLNAYEDSIGSSVGSDCRLGGGAAIQFHNDEMYFTTTKVDSSHLYTLVHEEVLPVIEECGSIDSYIVTEDRIIFVAMYAQKLQEIYEYNRATKKIKQVTKFNEAILKDKYVAKPNKLKIHSKGFDIEGWVLLPEDYDTEKKYPAILVIHGGPKTVYGEIYYHEMQYWVNMGYVVYFLNPFGADGRGNEFADIRGKYGTIDYDNIMDFTDEVLKVYPNIDINKMAVTGGSYGGYMTNWIIGHTNRFACACAQRSISNWISFYGISDIGVYFALDQQGVKDIYEGQEKLWWHSPLKYANKVVTPTLFIHSDEDYRCPMEQAMQMFTALKARDIDSKLVCFKGENHELSRGGKPKHRIKRLEEITKWIEKYTK